VSTSLCKLHGSTSQEITILVWGRGCGFGEHSVAVAGIV